MCFLYAASRRSRRDWTRMPRRRTRSPRSSSEERTSPVLAEHFPHRSADLPDRRPVPQRVLDRVEQIALARGDLPKVLEPRLDRRGVAAFFEACEALELPPFRLGVHPQDLDVVDNVGDELVDADH